MTPLEKAEIVLKRLKAEDTVCYDAETSGLDWRFQHVVGHVLTFGPRPEESYYLPFRHKPGGNIEGVMVPQETTGWDESVHPIEAEIIRLLERPTLTIFGHNLAFDLKFLYRLGLKRFRASFQDTQINAALINELQPSFSLDFCARRANVTPKKTTVYAHIKSLFPEVTDDKKAMAHFWRLAGDDAEAVEYAEGDGTSTWELRDWQNAAIRANELERVHNVECRMIPVLARMTTRGVKIDVERLHEVRAEVIKMKDAAQLLLPEGFNPRAPSQVRELMEKNGFTNWPKTAASPKFPQGQPSFPENWLKTNPVGQTIINMRKYSNLVSSFIDPMLETHLWRGRVHAEYNQLRGDEYGTITGRLSSSNPNLQQVHKRNRELGLLFRSIFVPDEGKVWASVDYSQCEPRLLAIYSRARVLMNGYLSDPPVDAHTSVATAAAIDRESGKRLNQALLTGAGRDKAATMLDHKTRVEADKIVDDYFEALPEIKTIQKQASQRMAQRGYVISLLGRHARSEGPRYVYKALNRLLQCGNADILKLKMVEVDEYLESVGRPVDMLNNVHDALDFQFEDTAEIRQTYINCLDIMTDFGPGAAIELDIPMGIEAQIGANWSEATYGKDKEYRQGGYIKKDRVA